MKKLFLISAAAVVLILALPGQGAAAHRENVPIPDKQERCPVCRMYVNQAPQWIAAASLKNGKIYYFDGPKDLFRFAFDTEKYLPQEKDLSIGWLYVTDYYTMKLEPAALVFFIIGSDVYGPMGHELVPVKGREKAEEFMKDHNGKKILTYSDITPETITGLK